MHFSCCKPSRRLTITESHVYRRAKDKGSATADWFDELMKSDAWFKNVVPKVLESFAHSFFHALLTHMFLQFRALESSELPPGCDGGSSFTSVCINTALYLPWLTSQCLKAGAILRRGIATHVSDAAALHHSGQKADLVINCTGLSSLTLGGVEDKNVYPARGQIVLVRNTIDVMASTSGTDDGSDEACYIMHRAAGGGCILGGCLQAGNWESQPDPNLAVRIMKRAVELRPDLVEKGKGIEGLSVIRHSVGLRPMRKGGIRVQKEVIGGVPVVHNYGHGGYGYQASYGSADKAVKLVNEVLGEKARL